MTYFTPKQDGSILQTGPYVSYDLDEPDAIILDGYFDVEALQELVEYMKGHIPIGDV